MDELFTHMIFEPGMHLFHALVPSHVLFETPEGGGGEGGGGGESGGEPAATAVLDPAAGGEGGEGGEGGGEGIDYLTPDDIAQLVRENAGSAFSEMLAEAERRDQAAAQQRAAAQQAQQANQPPQWDPFDPESVDRYVEWRAQQMLRPLMEQMAPAIETSNEFRLSQGRDQALGILESFHEELGVFDHEPAILAAARYQAQGLDAEEALQRAATEQAAYEAKLEARGVEKFKTAGQNLADVGNEPGITGAGAEATEPLSRAGQRRDYKTEAKATLARLGVTPGGVGTPTG